MKTNVIKAELPGDVQIRYRIKDVNTGYYTSAYSPSFTLHLVPKVEITSPSPPNIKFAFDTQTPDGVLTIPAEAILNPSQMVSDLVWDITLIEGSDLVIQPHPSMPTCIFTYKELPSLNSEFGEKYIYASFPEWNVKDSVQSETFFDKTSTNNPATPYANWHFYWGYGSDPDPVVTGLPGCAYNPLLLDRYGTTDTLTGYIEIGPRASRIHYECSPPGGPGCYGYLINGIRFGGDHVNGVDCTAEVVAHERFHKWVVLEAWAPGGRWYRLYGGPRTTGPFGNDRDGDWLPNFYEEMVSETDPDNPDTFDISGIFHNPGIYPIGDWKYVCMIEGNGKLGDHSRDWSAGIYSKQWP